MKLKREQCFVETVARKLMDEEDINIVVQTSDIKKFIDQLEKSFEIKAEFEQADLPDGEYYVTRIADYN